MAVSGWVRERGVDSGDRNEVIYVGATVYKTTEYIGEGDSSLVAVCWDAAEGREVRVIYGCDRPGSEVRPVTVDATPEVIAAWTAWRVQRSYERIRWEAERRAKVLERGRDAKVVKGRKVPVGTVGQVMWVGENKFGPGQRVGLRLASGEVVWTNADNVEVQDAERFMPSEDELRRAARGDVEMSFRGLVEVVLPKAS